MKTTSVRLALLAFAVLAALLPFARAADRVSLHGILIAASNGEGPSDRRLAPYEGNLKRVLRFSKYRHIGEGSASVDVPGSGGMSVGRGHALEIEAEEGRGGQARLRVRWSSGGDTVLNTGVTLAPGGVTVLGGAAGDGDEVYAIILIRR
jgi:hypothetical protein